MQLTKHHGLGNDFLVILESRHPGLELDPDFTRWVCDRHRGVGADGVLYGFAGSDGADVTMVLLNRDGSRAEISGNGIRCLAQAVLMESGRADGLVVVDTDAGRRHLAVTATDDARVHQVSVEMGVIGDGPAVPASLGVAAQSVLGLDIGNPHLVLLVDDDTPFDIAAVGPLVEAQVPGGVNVHVVLPAGDQRIAVTHWERGAGVTQACGSGASVSAAAARRWGLVGDSVTVDMPGGSARVVLAGPSGGERATLIGPAEFVAEVTLP